MIGIYKITNPKGKVYIGQSIHIEKRFKTYKNFGSNTSKQIKLYRSFKKYGFINHKFETLIECNLDELNELERYYQDLFDVLNTGLNLILVNTKDKKQVFSLETRMKLSNSLKGKGKGIKLTEEHKQKLRGKRNLSEETLKGFIERGKNKKCSNFTKLKMRESSKNKKLVLNVFTGIFYNSTSEAEEAYNITKNTLARRLNGNRKNNTQFIYA